MASEGVMGDRNIPFGIWRQSISGFDPTNGMAEHPYMDIVRSNLRFLCEQRGVTASEAGTASGAGQSWVSRYLARKILKVNNDKLDQLADYFGVSRSEIRYRDLSEPGALPPSQPTGQEEVIMAAAVKIEAYLQDMSPVPLPRESYPQRLFTAMQVAREVGPDAILAGDLLVEGARSLAARLRAIGG